MAEIVNINHESGALATSGYSSYVDDSGDLSVQDYAALVGSYGLSAVVDDTTSIYGRKLTSSSATVRARFYFNLNNITIPDGQQFEIFRIQEDGSPYVRFLTVSVHYTSANGYELFCTAYNDSGAAGGGGSVYINGTTTYCVEILEVRASSDVAGDGYMDWWLDGEAQSSTATALDNYNVMLDFGWRFELGTMSFTAACTGESYLDDLYANNDGGEIGCGGESASISPSASASPSASVSLSVSPSISPSVSPSISPSASPSPSLGPTGSVCWGHQDSPVPTEDNIETFQGNWFGTGAISNPGANNNEAICLEAGEYMVSEIVNTGIKTVALAQNTYIVGDDVDLDYRTGNSVAACGAAGWNNYVSPFLSEGYVQIRLTSTL